MRFSRRGKFGFGLLLLLLAGVAFVWEGVYPFLARHNPVRAEVLVVEGWVDDDLLQKAADWAVANGAKKIVATGGPIETGSWLAEWNSMAEMSLARMEAMGLAEKFELTAVPAQKVRRGRTRESARALRAALGEGGVAFNVASKGPHTRRTWMAFRDEFSGVASVGSVALEPREYDATDWWSCSEGVRDVIGELIAWGVEAF